MALGDNLPANLRNLDPDKMKAISDYLVIKGAMHAVRVEEWKQIVQLKHPDKVATDQEVIDFVNLIDDFVRIVDDNGNVTRTAPPL